MFAPALTTIRPNILPPNPQGGPRPQDQDKAAAQRAFFARALDQAQGTATAAPAAAAPPAQAPARTAAVSTAEPPQKVLRPGSLIDIRV